MRLIVRKDHEITRIAFVSTYPPRHCGIANFTHDLASTSRDREVAVLLPPGHGLPYPLEVHHRIRRDEAADYPRIAQAVGGCVDVISVQHAYDIWGGEDGDQVLEFVRAASAPTVATLHTIHRAPTPRQRQILTELIDTVAATVVMSKSAVARLGEDYGIDASRLDVIAHGAPDLPVVSPSSVKPALGLDGRDVILGFGLLGPAKGYEAVIDAMPAIIARHPTVCLAIVGVTRADIVGEDREAYRSALVARAAALGLGDHIRFVDRFVGRVELTRWLQAADVVVTPHLEMDQIVSGTLVYAMAAGRAIVSSPFTHAVEFLADDRGVIVAKPTAKAFATELNALLDDEDRRTELGARAYAFTRPMIWSETGAAYRSVFERVVGAPIGTTPARPRFTILNA